MRLNNYSYNHWLPKLTFLKLLTIIILGSIYSIITWNALWSAAFNIIYICAFHKSYIHSTGPGPAYNNTMQKLILN